MKNKLLIVVLLLSVLFSGCGDSGDSSLTVLDNENTWENDSEYEETDTAYEETDTAYEKTDTGEVENEFLDETQEIDATVAYELENICTGISDAGNGYKAEYTLSVTNWIRASSPETLRSIWKSIGGKNELPDISSFHERSNDGFTNENAAVAFGTLSFRNITDGFDFTEDNPRTFHLLLEAEGAYKERHSVKGYIEYSNSYDYFNLWDITDAVLSPKMIRNSWGPVPFILVCSNAFTPDNPNGDEVLNDCKIKCGSSYPATDELTLRLNP